MKRKISYLSVFAVLLCAACTQDDYTPFGPEQADYSHAQKATEIALQCEMEEKGAFETETISLPKNEVLSAFGVKKLPNDLVFFGVDKKGNRLYGPRYFTSASGFYFDKEGNVCSSANEDVCFFVDMSLSNLKLMVGQVPGACENGKDYTLHMGLATPQAYVPVELTVSITEAGEWAVYFKHPDGLTYSVYETVKTDYSALPVYIDEEALCSALGLSSFSNVISGMNAKTPTVTFYGLNADGSEYLNQATDGSGAQAGYTANGKGHWFNSEGDVCTWKSNGWFCFSEWNGSDNPIFFNIGQATTGVEAGMSVVIRQKFVHGDKEAVLTYKVHIVNKVTPDMGIDE